MGGGPGLLLVESTVRNANETVETMGEASIRQVPPYRIRRGDVERIVDPFCYHPLR